MDSLQQKATNLPKIYTFVIELCDSHVDISVWRVLEIPESYSFYDLHVALQDSMIWSDVELHKFDMKNPRTKQMEYIGIPDDLMCEAIVCEKEAKISEYFSLSNSECSYMYNFLQPWMFRITLKKVLPAIPHINYPRCIDGDGMAPEMLEQEDGDLSWDNVGFDLKNIEFRDPEVAWLDAFQGF